MHATICDFIADTVQNSIEAGASRIEVSLVEDGAEVQVSVKDNGKGMSPDVLSRVWDPFYTESGKHSKRKVGLGLPLLRQTAEASGGNVSLESKSGSGTWLKYSFAADNIDTPPLGDVAGTLLSLMNYPGSFELEFLHRRMQRAYTVSRLELESAAGSLQDAVGIVLVRDYLREQEKELENNERTA